MKSINPVEEKIRDLKNKIIMEQSQIQQLLSDLDVKKEMELPEEERKARQQSFKNSMAIRRAEISSLQEELKVTRLNKTGSSAFEWHPHKGMNRRQAREFRKSRRK